MNLQAMVSETGNLDLREMTARLVRCENLSRTDAANFLDAMLDPTATDSQIAAALIALTTKGETVQCFNGCSVCHRWRRFVCGEARCARCFLEIGKRGRP